MELLRGRTSYWSKLVRPAALSPVAALTSSQISTATDPSACFCSAPETLLQAE